MELCRVHVLHTHFIVYTGYCGASVEWGLSLSVSFSRFMTSRKICPPQSPAWLTVFRRSTTMKQPFPVHFTLLTNSVNLKSVQPLQPCQLMKYTLIGRGFWLRTFSGLLIAFKKPAIAFKDLWQQAWTAFFHPIKQRWSRWMWVGLISAFSSVTSYLSSKFCGGKGGILFVLCWWEGCF